MKRPGILVILTLALILVFTACTKAETTTSSTTVSTTTSTSTTSTTTSTKTTTTTTTTSAIPLLPVTTGNVTGITVAGVILSGAFGGQAAEERGFEWGTVSGKYEFSWAESGSYQPGSFNRSITGLTEGTTYYFRCKARNVTGWGYGEEKSFKTLAPAKITAVTPNKAKQGDNLVVTINGTAFTGATAVSFGDKVTVNKISVISETQISADITIAGQAAGGAKTISVTTPAGTATLAGAFNVERVLHTLVWTDVELNWLSQLITGQVQYAYTIHLRAGNKMDVNSTLNFTFGLEVQDGKLCYTGVTAQAWDNVYYKAYPNLRYNSAGLTVITDALPAEALQKLFNPPVDKLPLIESLTTGEGTMTITYYYP